MPCVNFHVGQCPPDCIYLHVFPADPPVLEGGVDATKALVDSWVMEYDAREKNPTLELAGIVSENESKIKALERELEIYECRYSPLQD
uniref:Uncharacterized protein n=1 Tax=Tanacetum cinerariifolium TaxID=118510 RepID=A0A6L2LZI6_TANCI|nr:hypothetical protein [Tanacetum cinerariifolium]